MGLFRKRTSDEQPPKVESTPEYVYVPPIDSRVPECPNCKGVLKKAPGSKTKCPLCGLYMFVRTNPHTRERVVVTEAQAEEIDDEIVCQEACSIDTNCAAFIFNLRTIKCILINSSAMTCSKLIGPPKPLTAKCIGMKTLKFKNAKQRFGSQKR